MANDLHDLATPKEVAAQLDVATSTLRAWSAQFASQLSIDANPPKERSGRIGRRLYNAQDVATLARARDLLRSGLTVSRTLDVLRTEPQPPVVQEPRALATGDMGRSLVTLATLATDQRDAIANLEARVAALERRPWWRRLFGR